MIRNELLEILVCPENHTRLTRADGELIRRLNEAVAAGRLRNRSGARVEERLDDGLVREDGTLLYAVRDGIPVMLVDEAIPLDQLA
ncbi:MAG: Trm112 family protein [Pirellulales bacterium]|nr:Trm112 family protein [Pirellulales bacterium]